MAGGIEITRAYPRCDRGEVIDSQGRFAGTEDAVMHAVDEVDHQADRHPDDQPDPGVERAGWPSGGPSEITPIGAVNQTSGALNGRSTSGCVIRRYEDAGRDDGEGEQGADRGQLAGDARSA